MSFEIQEYKEKSQYVQENNIMVKMVNPKKKNLRINNDPYRLLWDCKLFLIDCMKNKKEINEDTIHLLFDEFVKIKK